MGSLTLSLWSDGGSILAGASQWSWVRGSLLHTHTYILSVILLIEGWQKVTLRGTSSQVAQAKRLIEEIVEEEKDLNVGRPLRYVKQAPPHCTERSPLFSGSNPSL